MHHCFSSTTDYSTENNSALTNFLTDELDGEFCYVQTSDGKIVSIHHALTDNYQGINIKRSIASTFQANFDSNKEDVEETDASSIHTSHYRCECLGVLHPSAKLLACMSACVHTERVYACVCVCMRERVCV